MAALSPTDDTYETLLTTLDTAAVFTTGEPNFEVDGNALLPKIASNRTTKPLIEMEPLLNEEYASFLDELDDVEERSEAEVLEELSTRSQHICGTWSQRARGSEDAFQSYLHDIRGFGRLTHAEEIELARRVAVGDERARRTLIESNLRLVPVQTRYLGM